MMEKLRLVETESVLGMGTRVQSSRPPPSSHVNTHAQAALTQHLVLCVLAEAQSP